MSKPTGLDRLICKMIGHSFKFVSYYGDSIYKQNFKCRRCGEKIQRYI